MNLHDQGVDEAVICAYGGASELKQAARGTNSMKLHFVDEPLPVGNAGCIRDAYDGDRHTVFIVLQASMMSPPDVDLLLQMCRIHKSSLTVVLGSVQPGGGPPGIAPEIYVCDPGVVEYMPAQGYFDIKEGLIPTMVKARQIVGAVTLPRRTCCFRDGATYLAALGHWLRGDGSSGDLQSAGLVKTSQNLWQADGASIDSNVITDGPVVVMNRARITGPSVIFGPTLIEADVSVGRDSIIDSSALWGGASVGSHCHVCQSVITHNVSVPDHSVMHQRPVFRKLENRLDVWNRILPRRKLAVV